MEILSLETLSEFDGGTVSVLVNRALRDAYLDCDDRATLKKDRKVTIEISLKPRDTNGNDMETSECSIAVKVKIPNKESRVNIVTNDRTGGGFGFESDTRKAKHHRNQAILPNVETEDE